MTRPNNLIDCRDVRAPCLTLCFEKFVAGRGQAIVTRPRTAPVFDPTAFDELLFLEPAQDRIQGTDPKFQTAAGTLFNEFSDFVSVPVLLFKKRKDQEFGTAFLKFAAK